MVHSRLCCSCVDVNTFGPNSYDMGICSLCLTYRVKNLIKISPQRTTVTHLVQIEYRSLCKALGDETNTLLLA